MLRTVPVTLAGRSFPTPTMKDLALLTADAEAELGRRARAGDLAARNELVERNLGYVLYRVSRYRAVCRDDDLLQAGCVGLIEAANVFDPNAHPGKRFLAIAQHYVQKEMVKYLYSRTLVRIPVAMRRPEGGPRTTERRRENRRCCNAAAAMANRPHWYFEQPGIADHIRARSPADPKQQIPGETMDADDSLQQLCTAM